MKLYLLRHGDAGDGAATRAADDARTLTERGRSQAQCLAEHLARIGLSADQILTSPLPRARETAEPVARALGLQLRIESALAPGFDLKDLAKLISGESNRNPSLILVGHNPDLSILVSTLCRASISLKKGAFVRMTCDWDPRSGVTSLSSRATLDWLLPPHAYMTEH